MPATAHPKFEVATIKPAGPASTGQGFEVRGRHVFIANRTLSAVFSVAYAADTSQIIGAPDWFNTDRYDIDGVPDVPGQPSLKQMQEMLQSLLTERLGIRFHKEKRPLSVYAVVLAKGGSKLQKAEHADALPDENGWRNGNQRFLEFTTYSMDEFALDMQLTLKKPVINKTPLTGRYDFTLKWTPDDVQNPDANAPPGIFTAVQEQLGLKLEATKEPVDVYVIDHIDRPSAN